MCGLEEGGGFSLLFLEVWKSVVGKSEGGESESPKVGKSDSPEVRRWGSSIRLVVGLAGPAGFYGDEIDIADAFGFGIVRSLTGAAEEKELTVTSEFGCPFGEWRVDGCVEFDWCRPLTLFAIADIKVGVREPAGYCCHKDHPGFVGGDKRFILVVAGIKGCYGNRRLVFVIVPFCAVDIRASFATGPFRAEIHISIVCNGGVVFVRRAIDGAPAMNRFAPLRGCGFLHFPDIGIGFCRIAIFDGAVGSEVKGIAILGNKRICIEIPS
jgi:hypothetical protein